MLRYLWVFVLAQVDSLSLQTRENVPQGKELKRNYINSPYRNFFKHADSDHHATVPPVPDSLVDSVLFLAVEDYIRLKQKSPLQFQVFQLWYIAMHPAKLDPGVAEKVLASASQVFPGITDSPRPAQLALGAQMLQHAARDAELLADARTEPAFECHET